MLNVWLLDNRTFGIQHFYNKKKIIETLIQVFGTFNQRTVQCSPIRTMCVPGFYSTSYKCRDLCNYLIALIKPHNQITHYPEIIQKLNFTLY